MKSITIEIELFEEGDRVITPSGSGIVLEDEPIPVNNEREVLIRLDNAPTSVAYGMNGWYVVLEEIL